MFFRSLICGVLLVLGLAYAQFAGAAVQKAAAAATTARYKGNYFFFVINPQNFFQYGGIFNIATNGTVVGWIFNNQNVATAITPGTTIIDDGSTGVIVPPGTPDELASAIATMHASPDVTAKMGKAALAKSADFTWDRSIDTFERILRETVAASEERT